MLAWEEPTGGLVNGLSSFVERLPRPIAFGRFRGSFGRLPAQSAASHAQSAASWAQTVVSPASSFQSATSRIESRSPTRSRAVSMWRKGASHSPTHVLRQL
jgi:hypothetical protein